MPSVRLMREEYQRHGSSHLLIRAEEIPRTTFCLLAQAIGGALLQWNGIQDPPTVAEIHHQRFLEQDGRLKSEGIVQVYVNGPLDAFNRLAEELGELATRWHESLCPSKSTPLQGGDLNPGAEV